MKARHVLWLLPMSLLAVLGLVGCGGTIDDDNGYDGHHPGYPRYIDLVLILRVQNASGYPVGDASVYVDDDLASNETDDVYHPLGEGYPVAWVGWLANWVNEDYQVVMNDYGDEDQFEIRVTKSGWTEDRSLVTIHDYEPDQVFIRDTMTLHRLSTASTRSAAPPHLAEVVSGKGIVRTPSGGPKVIIRSSED